MARKTSLRDFQEYLSGRLTGAASGRGASSWLGLQAGDENWLVDLSDSGDTTDTPTNPWLAVTYGANTFVATGTSLVMTATNPTNWATHASAEDNAWLSVTFRNGMFVAVADEDLCARCGECVDRCQFGAASLWEGFCQVDTGRCVGCGLCVTTCAPGALRLERRPPGEVQPPPANIGAWLTERAHARGLEGW